MATLTPNPQDRRLPVDFTKALLDCKKLRMVRVANVVAPYLGRRLKDLSSWTGNFTTMLIVKFALVCKRRGCLDEKEAPGDGFRRVQRAFNLCQKRDLQGRATSHDDE